MNRTETDPTVSRANSEQPKRRPEKATTVEDVVDALDYDRNQADRAALEYGVSRELAAALASELGTQVQLDQRVAHERGVSYAEWKQQAEREAEQDIDPLALSMELADYAAGKGELSNRAQEELAARVDQINAELDELEETGFSAKTIAKLRGAEESYDVAMLAEQYRALSEARKGSEQLPTPAEAVGVVDRQERKVPSKQVEVFRNAYQRFGVEGALNREPGLYRDQKGAELVVETMKELGMDEGDIVRFAQALSAKYDQFIDSAKTIYADKSEQTQAVWAENQVWESLKRDAVWQRLESKIDQYGDSLAGKGTRLSRSKIMSSFLIFSRQLS